jgi:hypothetical protein
VYNFAGVLSQGIKFTEREDIQSLPSSADATETSWYAFYSLTRIQAIMLNQAHGNFDPKTLIIRKQNNINIFGGELFAFIMLYRGNEEVL